MAKSIFDLLFSILGLVITSPLMLIIALLIKFDSPGPILFCQERVGKGGKLFKIYKFRTMVVDAEKVGPELTVYNDPRITKVGKWLRRSSLDELPQLFNVLKGEMSIVGPRPEIPSIVKTYSAWQRRVLSVKPGITGLSQVSGRANLSVPTKLRLDIYYIKHQSLWFDVKIILQTIKEIFSQRGAF